MDQGNKMDVDMAILLYSDKLHFLILLCIMKLREQKYVEISLKVQ